MLYCDNIQTYVHPRIEEDASHKYIASITVIEFMMKEKDRRIIL